MPGREWDMRIVWLVDRQCWWWNAWHTRTQTELYGRTETRTDARNAMTVAISDWRSRSTDGERR